MKKYLTWAAVLTMLLAVTGCTAEEVRDPVEVGDVVVDFTDREPATDEEMTDEEMIDEVVTDEEMIDEVVIDEEMTDEVVTDEVVIDEEMTDEVVTDEEMA